MVGKKLLIVCAPRSGSYYTSLLLQAAGYDVKGESWGADGMVSWAGLFPDSYLGEYKEGCTILHQIREPIASINSIRTLGSSSWHYMATKDKEIKAKLPNHPTVSDCLRVYVRWNTRCIAKAKWSYRVEDLDPEYHYDIPKTTNTRKAADPIATAEAKVFSIKYGDWTWEDILDSEDPLVPELFQMALKYKYPLPNLSAYCAAYGSPFELPGKMENAVSSLLYQERNLKND